MKIKFSKIFDWSIRNVSKPLPTKGQFSVWDEIPDQILFWSVVVDYVYHGKRVRIFCEPDEKSGTGLKKATMFYEKMSAKIKVDGEKTR